MWGKNSWCLVLGLILFCGFVSASSVRINEIYVNGTKEYEWVELYNPSNEDVNLTNWQFGDDQDNDTIKGELILEPNKYALLTSKLNYVYFLWEVGSCKRVYTEDALGNGLSNNGEKIYLYDNLNNTIDFLNYPNLNENIYSLNESNDWNIVFNGTPGYANFYTEICDPYVEILLDKNIFLKGEIVYFTPKVYGISNYTIRYWIEDLNGNIVKSLVETSNSNQKQWTPSDKGSFIIKADLIFSDCDDINMANNFKTELIGVYTIESNLSIKINELLPNPQGYDDATMPEGEWVELYNIGSEDLDLEGLGLKDDYGSDTDIYISNSNTMDGTIIKANGYLVVYMNGRYGFLNNDGFEKISLYEEDYLIDEVSYSGSTEGLSWNKLNNLWIQSILSPGESNIGNESLRYSNITIKSIYDLGNDKVAKFGQTIRVKFMVFNVEEYSKVIRSWVESEEGDKVSKEAKFETPEKFSEGIVTIPIQLMPNCDKKFSDGEYKLIIDGLGEREEENIEIADITEDLCEEIKIETIKESSTLKSSESNLKDSITGNVIFEDKGLKQKRSALYFFCALLILIVVYYCYGRE